MDPQNVTFGKVLREKRVSRGLTQKGLAELAHVDDSYISQLERDYKFPSARTIESLAQALGVEVAELLAMYFPPGEARGPTTFVGREAECRAFEECLAGPEAVLVLAGGPGQGKTALINERFLPRCREGRVPYIYFDLRRLPTYRSFLKDLRDTFASRKGGYRAFDEIFEQCESIERRMRSRFQDPFSLQVSSAPPQAPREAETELTYAEKYIYREAERLLTEELLAGWRTTLSPGAPKAVIFLDDYDAVGATVGFWIGWFLERVAEAGVLGDKLLVVIASPASRQPTFPVAEEKVRAVVLEPFTPGEVEAYVHERGLTLTDDDWQLLASLQGDVRALTLWGDYFEAAGNYGRNRLGRAEETLRRLDEEIATYAGEAVLRRGALLHLRTRRLLGHLTRLQGRLAEAAEYYGSAAALAETLEDRRPADLGYLYLDLGHVSRHRGRWEEAVDYYHRAGEEFASCGERLGAGITHSSLGTAFRLQAKFARAKQEYRQAAAALEALAAQEAGGREARRWLASSLSNHAITVRLEAENLWRAGDSAGAEKALARAKALCREALEVSDDAAETAVAENRLALCLAAEARARAEEGASGPAGDLLAEATQLHKRALAAFEDLGDQYRVAQVLADLGVAASQQGLFHDAILHFKNSLALFQQMGSRYHASKVLVDLGLLSEGGEQLSYFAEALATARGHNDESLAEIAAAVREALVTGGAARARRFFEEQVAAEAKLAEYFPVS
ncbi:MAG: helix-turn-helix transcriptional regulator [Candidatus Coatesbacteria bacterium]|nr:MAG: helix-turn-helix transcriptional regulator [Candidatus Coatesbacteria bacterium]